MVMDWRCTKHPALMMRDQPANMWFYLTSKLRPWMCERQVPVPSNGMVQPWKSKHFRPQTLNLKFWRVSTFKMNGFRSSTWPLLWSAEVPQHHRPSPRARWQASANVLWAAWSRRNAMRKPTRCSRASPGIAGLPHAGGKIFCRCPGRNHLQGAARQQVRNFMGWWRWKRQDPCPKTMVSHGKSKVSCELSRINQSIDGGVTGVVCCSWTSNGYISLFGLM